MLRNCGGNRFWYPICAGDLDKLKSFFEAKVKRYEIFEGTAFQWFMCNGILMVGFTIAALTGELERGISPLVILGGILWALSNYLVLPLVKLLGLLAQGTAFPQRSR